MSAPLPLPYRLESERLILRCYEPEDAPVLFEAIDRHRAYMAEWLPWVETAHQSLSDSELAVRQIRGRYDLMQDFTMGIFDRAGRFVGGTGLHRLEWALGRFEIGYWLTPEATGQGYATETAWRLTQAAFDLLAGERVEIRVDTGNRPSCKVAERLGFPLEGVMRASTRLRGEMRDLALYAMTRRDFAGR